MKKNSAIPKTLESIKTADIRPNDWNGNRSADEGLVESVRQHGILQPICVEKDKDGKGYVCVFGARRLDAATRAGLKTIQAYVLPAKTGKREVRLLTLVENMQREAQDPVTEGFIYKALIEGGMSEAEVAERSGAGRRAVRQRLVLTKLCPQAVELLETTPYKLAAVAMLAECTPSEQVRIIEGKPYLLENPYEMESEIKRDHPLVQAPFDTEDGDLLPGAGPCSMCPKRTGAQELLFGEPEDAGSCLDAACHAAKTAAHVGREVAKIRKANPTAKCVVERDSYAWATPENKAVYDSNGAEPMKEMRLATSDADKANPEAQKAILLNQGTVREVVIVPNPRQKDGRAAKPKTPEEKAAYLEKKRAAWMADTVRKRLAEMHAKGAEAFREFVVDAPTLGATVLQIADAAAGVAEDGPCDAKAFAEAAWTVFNSLYYALASRLATGSVFAIEPERLLKAVELALEVTDPGAPASTYAAMEADAKREIPE